MRNLTELGMNEGSRPVTAGPLVVRKPPTDEQIRAFELAFKVTLPADYVAFLRFANGGHPKCGTFYPSGVREPVSWNVNVFYHLDDDKTDLEGLWGAAGAWQRVLSAKMIPIADDACGDQLLLSFDTCPPSMVLCVHEGVDLIEVAKTFGDFIDMLECPE